jgi:hypothetical protein
MVLEKRERFEHEWEQTRSLLTLYANLHRDSKTPAHRPTDFIRLSYDKPDTQVNMYDNPQLLEEFKRRFKPRKKRG